MRPASAPARRIIWRASPSRSKGCISRPSGLRAVGWTKLMTICPHLTKANWKELLAAAEKNTNRELQMMVKGEEPANNQHCVLLYFNDDDYKDFVQSALHHGAARSGRGLLNKEKAIMALVKKDLEEPHEAQPKKPSAAKKKLLA